MKKCLRNGLLALGGLVMGAFSFCQEPLSAGTHPPVMIMAVEPPRGPRVPGWTQWVNDIQPHVNGVTLICQWDKVETSQGVYDWTSCDNEFVNFSSSLKFGIVLEPIGFQSNTSTPSYIYSEAWAKALGAPQLDYVTCKTHPGNGQTPLNSTGHTGDTSAFPAVWEKPFQAGWHNFLANAIVHYNAVSWKQQIAYIRPGYSEGGQSSDPCEPMMIQLTGSIANLQSLWVGGNQAQAQFIAAQNPQMPFQMAIACPSTKYDCTDWADAEAATNVSLRIGIGSEGAQNGDITSAQDGRPSTSDWVAMFDKYSATPVVRELQSWTQTSVLGNPPTGSLADLLPFEANSDASVVELYLQDLQCAYVAGYGDSTGCPHGHSPYVPYQDAIAAAQK